MSYCGYSPTSPFFLLLSEHKHGDKAATNSSSENARSRMVASLRGSVGTGTKENESSTGRIWAAGFHRVTARSRLAHVFKIMNRLFIYFSKFISGRCQTRITETADTEFADTAVHMYILFKTVIFNIIYTSKSETYIISF